MRASPSNRYLTRDEVYYRMSEVLDGKVAIVTGGNRGLGKPRRASWSAREWTPPW